MTPQEKAEAVVVAGMPAGKGFGGVLVRQWNVDAVRPPGSIVFADQEGGAVRTFRALAPTRAASRYRSAAEAFRAGRETAAGLRRAGVHATFAPVLDLADGPLGSRQFAKPEYGVAFARGLGAAACPKHFPGLGSTPQVDGRRARLRRPPRAGPGAVPGRDPRRRAVRDGRPCDLSRGSGRAGRRSSRRRMSCCDGSASAASRSRTRLASSAAPTRRSGRGSRSVRAPTWC